MTAQRALSCTHTDCPAQFPVERSQGICSYAAAQRSGWRFRGTPEGNVWYCPEHPAPPVVRHRKKEK